MHFKVCPRNKRLKDPAGLSGIEIQNVDLIPKPKVNTLHLYNFELETAKKEFRMFFLLFILYMNEGGNSFGELLDSKGWL